MIVVREFRIGSRRYLKGEHYTEKDAQKWVDAGYVNDTAQDTKKGPRKEAK